MNTFTKTLTPHFRQTDSAGVLFFNEAFNLFHDAYEEWAAALVGDAKTWFNNETWAVPIKKANADFRRPLYAFDPCEVKITLQTVGQTSFQLTTEIWQNNALRCTLETVHVFLSKKEKSPQGIPEEIRAKLEVKS
jgi:1,4-dihydroxy-2-naphthoyl-CoA hydrolase